MAEYEVERREGEWCRDFSEHVQGNQDDGGRFLNKGGLSCRLGEEGGGGRRQGIGRKEPRDGGDPLRDANRIEISTKEQDIFNL